MSTASHWYILDPVLIVDMEFLADYVHALSFSGLARKKAVAELVQFGCIECCEGVYVVFDTGETKTVVANGVSVSFLKCHVIFDILMVEYVIGRKLPAEMMPKRTSAEAWIVEAEVLKLSESEMKAQFDERRARRGT